MKILKAGVYLLNRKTRKTEFFNFDGEKTAELVSIKEIYVYDTEELRERHTCEMEKKGYRLDKDHCGVMYVNTRKYPSALYIKE